MILVARDLVEVVDETSRLYHRQGVIVGFTRNGRPIVEFERRRRRFSEFPLRLLPWWASSPITMVVEQLGIVLPST